MRAARESEFAYFRAAAVQESGPDWFVAQMPGLEYVPSASYGFLDPSCGDGDAVSAAVAGIEAAFERLGARQTRFYTNEAAPALAGLLGDKGYRCREEIIALQSACQPDPVGMALDICEVTTEADWSSKLALHDTSDLPSDGHRTRALDWVALERRKAETGVVTFYLFRQDGEVVATAGLLRPAAGTIRMKNLFVSAHHRQRGIGRAVLEVLSNQVHQTHRCCPILYFLAGTAWQDMYASIGYRPIGSAFEWIRERP